MSLFESAIPRILNCTCHSLVELDSQFVPLYIIRSFDRPIELHDTMILNHRVMRNAVLTYFKTSARSNTSRSPEQEVEQTSRHLGTPTIAPPRDHMNSAGSSVGRAPTQRSF
ncbi:hypothetical protein BU23DRAFT_315924 [Bimuria novae-zelandiae CBS 107.79]|uniref:Uncharacterized protein n=1 Tax=Bimuria novae-zelandiae CBS 107.79 TaxID=1447943 RepID=A0A6A5URE9_9PLEO|nr:hypothetical protein BU23DRAFT_315924 [Bimuria novae-zelandiae CBS 107.79]